MSEAPAGGGPSPVPAGGRERTPPGATARRRQDVLLVDELRDRRWALGRIRSFLGPRLARVVDAEDVLQDTLAIAVRQDWRAQEWKAPQVRAWILRVARRRVLLLARALRARSRPRRDTSLPSSHLTHMDAAELELAAGPRGSATGPDAPALAPGFPLARLAGQGRRVLWLREHFTLPWGTVSFLVDRTHDASRQLHYRARKRLARGAPRR